MEGEFRMSKTSLLSLAEELRPFMEEKETIMRSPVDVVKQVALISITWATKADFERQPMLLEFQDK
mgnify:CR=1 FL=1